MTRRLCRLERADDERGDYAIFIAIIATALLLLGGIAYDGPRLTATRQHAAHVANEAAAVAAATVGAGGTLAQAQEAAEQRLMEEPLRDGEPFMLQGDLNCVVNRIELAVVTAYRSRSALAVFRDRHTVVAHGAAVTELVRPDGSSVSFGYLPECPLLAGP